MVQAKAKRRGSSVRKFMARLRSPQIYLPWLTQSVRHLHPDSVFSAVSATREVRISRQRLRRPERQGPVLEALEPRILLSNVSWIAPAGGDWGVGANWSTGTVPGSGDTAIIASLNPGAQVTYSTGNSTVAAVQASSPLEITGGTLTVSGSAAITGTTFTLDGGTLADATLSTASGGIIQTAAGSTTTLDAATLDSNLTVSSNSTLDIADNLTLGSGTTITVDAGGKLNFVDGSSNTQTVSGSGSITLDAASGTYAAAELNASGANSGSQVTFDNGVNITGLGTGTAPSTITAASGNTIAFDNTITNATVSSSGGYLQADGSYGSATVFDAVTLANNVSIGGGGYGNGPTLDVADGLSFTHGAVLSFAGYFGTLAFVNGQNANQSISGTGTIQLTNPTTGSSGSLTVSSSTSSITVDSGVAITMGSASYGGYGFGGSPSITVDGNLIDYGSITSAGGDATISGSGILTNYGGITAGTNGSNGTSNTFTISSNVQSYAAFNADGGIIDFSGGTNTLGAGSSLQASGTYGAIELSGATLTVDAAVSANALNFSSGTINGTGSVNLSGPSNIWSGGTNDGILTVTSGAVLNITSTVYLGNTGISGAALDNAGTVNMTSNGTFYLYDNAAINNETSGTFDIQNAGNFYAQDTTLLKFNNAGILEKTVNTGTSTLGSYSTAGVALVNASTGTVVVDTGTLQLNAGGSNANTSGTAFTVAGGILNFSGETFTLNGNTTISATGSGQIDLTGATLTSDGILAINALNFSSGTLNGTGSVNLSGPSNTWSGGTNDGILTVTSGAMLNITSAVYLGNTGISGAALDNAGTVNMTGNGTFYLYDNAAINNETSGTFDIQNAGNFYAQDATSLTFNNAGILEKTVNTGTSTLGSYSTAGLALVNASTGTVVVDTGTLQLNAGGSNANTSGTAFTAAGGILNFNNETFTLNGNTTINATGSGQIDLTGATLTTDGILTINALNFSSGTINGTGSVNLSGTDTWSGGTNQVSVAAGALVTLSNVSINTNWTIDSGAVVTLTGPYTLYLGNATLTNDGTLSYAATGTLYINGTATINNQAGGTFAFGAAGTFDTQTPGTLQINNLGTLETTSGSGTTDIEGAIILANRGTVSMATGTNLLFENGASATGNPFVSFTAQGIGTSSQTGVATYNAGSNSWTLAGAGTGMGTSSDQFNYVSQSVSGDCQIIAQIDGNTDSTASEGIMLRDSTNANAAFADVLVNSGGVSFQWRPSDGGSMSSTEVTGISPPVWVQIQRQGSSYSAYYSTNGTTWVQVGSSQTLSFSNSANLAGLVAVAGTDGSAGTASFSHFSMDYTLNGATVSSSLTVQAGATLYVKNGLTLQNGATITVDAGGAIDFVDGTGNTQSVSGNGQIVLAPASGSSAAGQINADGANSGSTVTFDNGINISGPGNMNAAAGNTIVFENTVTGASLSWTTGGALQVGTATFNAVTLDQGITITSGQMLNLEGDWRTTGTINIAGGTLNLGGTFTSAALGMLNYTSGQVELSGTLNNSGNTLSASTLNNWTMAGGTITGGTIGLSGDVIAMAAVSNSSGVTLDGVTVANGVTLDINSGTVSFTGAWSNTGSTINIDGGTINLGGNVTLGEIGTLHYTSGQVELSGTLNNTGNTLTLTSTTTGPTLVLIGGSIIGGTVDVPVGMTLQANGGSGVESTVFNADGGTVDFVSGSYTFNTGTTFMTSGTGIAEITGGSYTLNALNIDGKLSVISPANTYSQYIVFNIPSSISIGTGSSGVLNLEQWGSISWGDESTAIFSLGNDVTLTLDTGVTVQGGALIETSGRSATLVNNGSILLNQSNSSATGSNEGIVVETGVAFVNNGTVQVVDLGSFAVAGTAQTFVGSAMAISPTEVVFGWYGLPMTAGDSYTISQSTNGVDFTTIGTVLPKGNYDVVEGLSPNTTYYFKVQETSASGATWVYVSSPVITNVNEPDDYAAGYSGGTLGTTTEAFGLYQVGDLLTSSGQSIPTSEYNTGTVAAGSAAGAYLQAVDGLLATSASSNAISLPYAQDPGTSVAGGLLAPQPQCGPGRHYVTTYNNTNNGPTNPPYTPCSCPAPFGAPAAGTSNPISYYNGSPQITSPGLSSSGFDGNWGVNLNWTSMTVFTANTAYGNGWSSQNQGYLEYLGGGTSANPNIMLVNSAYNQDVFNFNTATSQYQAQAVSTNTLIHNDNGTYTVATDIGTTLQYYDFSNFTPVDLQGQLISMTDAAGNTVTFSYTSSGQISSVTQTDAAGDVETFNYTYITSGVNAGNVSLITQSLQRAGQTSSTIYRQMALTYYDGSYSGNMQYGNAGDLQTVSIEDGSGNILKESFYRYYTPGDMLNSGGAQIGYVGGLQYVFNTTSFKRLSAAFADPFSATAAQVAPYADNYFQYNADHEATLETFARGGAAVTGGLGTQSLSYELNPNSAAGGNYNTWFMRTTVTLQDGSENVVYTNVNGDVMLSMTVDPVDVGNPSLNGAVWITAYNFNSQGQTLETIHPSAINLNAAILNGATTASAIETALQQYSDLGIAEGLVYSNQGLIDSTVYYGATTATATAPGGVSGNIEADYVQQGSGGTPIEQDSYTYIQHLDSNGNTLFPEAAFTQYQSSDNGGSTPETTTYSYSWQNNSSGQVTNQIADMITTNPVVSTSQNGSGVATTTQTVYNQFGQVVWTMDAKGFITYTAYDNATGAVIQTVQDVNTANLSDIVNYSGSYAGGTLAFGSDGYNQYGVPELPSGWITPTGAGLNLTTTDYVDALGRTIESISPGGNITLYVYDDPAHAVFTLTGVVLDTSNNTLTTTGPITMTRTEIPYSYSANGQTLEGSYNEAITFSANTPISYVGGGIGQAVIPVLPGFIQGDAAVSGPDNVFNLIGDGSSSSPQFTLQSLTRSVYNAGGQQVESDAYAVIDNAVYLATAPNDPYSGGKITNQLSGQAPNGNYYATYYGYDADGRQYQIIDANGTITDTVYDSLGRAVSIWVGTNDTVSGGTGTPTYFVGSNAGLGNNMTEVTSYVYDNGSVGDSNVTEVIQYPDGTANTGTQRVSLLNYDFRDRLVATETGLTLNSSGSPVASSSDPYPLITVSSLDNLGDVTATLTFNGAVTTIANAIVAAATAAPGAVLAGLVGYRTSEYDSQNRDYEDQTYSVDPTTGAISTTALTTYTFYGPRGNIIETVAPTGQVTKDVYNGVGELVDVYITDGGAVNNGGSTVLTYAAAESVSNDVVISQTAYGYAGDGNLIETVHAQRFNTDPILGSSAEGALFTNTVNADGSLTVTPASNADLGARIYYSATYYDASDRQIATVNAGTNPTGTNGTAAPWTRPANAPVSVNDSNFTGDLITLTSYNPAGEVYETTDPRGIVAANFYNSLGETVETIAAYDPSVNGGNPTSDQNQTTLYTYDGIGDQTSMTAEDPSTGNQTTDYVYGVSAATGSGITSNDLLYQTVYPSNGQNDTVSQEYNALGQVIQSTDRNGNVHQYAYDTAGREISDTVTTLGAGVDGSVRRIDTTYNAQGLAYLLTSYADTAGTTIVNQVENIYNGLGQLAFQYQALTGAVDVSTTPYVQYTYSSPSNGSRVTSMVYPNGRTIDYNYSGTNLNSALDNAIDRLDSISDGANSGEAGQVLEQYSYLGLSTIVARNHPQTGINLTLVGSAGSIGSGGDQYVGLDQFGRIADQNWVNTSSGMSADNFTYTYDNNSNVASENNLLNTAYSQTFTYDPLNRLASNTLGGVANQSWTLDSQGNWSSYTSNGVTQTQTANAQNQITSISGAAGTPTYDANGNMTTDQSANTYTYNAWNQLVAVRNSSGQVIAQYTYNAMGYRITESYPLGGNGVAAGTVNYIYYDSQWQAIETRTNGTASSNVTSQTVWSAAYINAAILQDTYSGGVIQPGSRIYFLQDANWDTTAILGYDSTTGTWGVTQRYTYSPYGTITVLNADWSTPPAGTQPTVDNLYQGMTLDSVTGLYYARNRNYDPSLGRWINQDPAGYINGANTYQFVMGNPTNLLDPSGESQDRYAPDKKKHGPGNGPHVDRYSPGRQNVGRYRPDGTPIPHGGVCPPPIPNSDRKKFKDAVDKLGKGVVIVGGGVAVGVGVVWVVDNVLPWVIIGLAF